MVWRTHSFFSRVSYVYRKYEVGVVCWTCIFFLFCPSERTTGGGNVGVDVCPAGIIVVSCCCMLHLDLSWLLMLSGASARCEVDARNTTIYR